jgi:hypothetical protein
VDIRLFNLWEEVLGLASSLEISSEEDEHVWQYSSSCVYSSQCLQSDQFQGCFACLYTRCLET